MGTDIIDLVSSSPPPLPRPVAMASGTGNGSSKRPSKNEPAKEAGLFPLRGLDPDRFRGLEGSSFPRPDTLGEATVTNHAPSQLHADDSLHRCTVAGLVAKHDTTQPSAEEVDYIDISHFGRDPASSLISEANESAMLAIVNTEAHVVSDFGCGDDDLDSPMASDHHRKRRRIEFSVRLPPPLTTIHASRPTLPAGRRPPLGRRAVDPIEVSSSMEQSSPSGGMVRAEPLGKRSVSMDADPFASSPDPADRARPSRGAPGYRHTRSRSLTPVDHSRMLATRRDQLPSAVQSAAALPRSSTSPFPEERRVDAQTNVIRRPSCTLPREWTRVVSDNVIISIDDSDSSDHSDDSALTDIGDLGLPRRPSVTRAPLDRSQSSGAVSTSRPGTGVSRRKATRGPPADKAAREAAKVASKEQQRRERAEAKEAKAREKERAAALAAVNKLRTNKKISTPEMIVDLPSGLAPDQRVQTETILESLGVEFTCSQSSGRSIIRWRRKVTSRFDDDLGRWEPIPPCIRDERQVLVIVGADEFVDLATKHGLDDHVADIKDEFRDHDVIYLLQGLVPWMRKNRNLRNRQFVSKVRGHQAPTAPPGRSRRNNAEYVHEDAIEDALLRLQVEHDVFIQHATIAAETAKCIATLTQQISTIPYKKQRDHAMSSAGFCMEGGQVRSGDDAEDTYIKMMQEIARITAPIAYGVAAEFGSVTKLVEGLETGGPETLEGVQRSTDRHGRLSDRVIGPAVSKRVYKVFMGRDDTSTDV
ncbi:hypothetical protein DCS_08241 [Drechmeria coniospora]|uniref:ERCC4 domain-containing protein n=1 Tax=Drechmeria coniospora TaxID=98403 RepID=A0A151GGW5_DRECN|nr:hypothetical protein DCS_08241 [Drechmeria coniospora]KYK56271.1 hypothetical protein DCS_08241 [Drechmeria coniospora]